MVCLHLDFMSSCWMELEGNVGRKRLRGGAEPASPADDGLASGLQAGPGCT